MKQDRKILLRRRVILSGLSTGLITSLITTQPVLAQGASGGLEEIVVTARKIEENLQDTPISITAFSGDALFDRQIFQTKDLDQVTPNLSFTNQTALAGNNSSSTVFIRGVGQTDPTSTVDPGVGLYIDEVYMGQSVGATMEFLDISGVQILRGPQGTLFGKNTIGGALLLTTEAPGDEFGGRVRVGLGDDNLLHGFVALDAPASDDLKTRFTFGGRKQDGYVTRVQTGEDLGDTNTWTTTGKLVWTPNDQWNVRFQYDYTKADENGNPFVFAASNEAATFQRVASADAGCPGVVFPTSGPVPQINDDRCANDFQNKGPFNNNGTYEITSQLKNYGGSLHLSHEASDSITLKSITSSRKLKWEGIRDADNTPLSILHTSYDSDGEQFSQEFQFLYNTESLNGAAGFYYFTEKVSDIVFVQLNIPPPGVQEDSDNNITDNNNWALFTQWTYDFNERFSATLGGRYTEDTKASTPDQFNYANLSVKYLPVQKYERTFDDFSISASAAYRFSDTGMVYLSYAEAFKGGGWNSHFNRPQSPDELAKFHQFDPEEAQTIELGAKLDLADNTLRLNGAVFTTDYDDLQFTYRVGVAPYLANAGKASIDGFEVELAWAPTSEWLIEGGIGHLNTSIDTLREIAGTGIGVEIGNRLPFSPEWQANLGVGYTAILDSGFSIVPRADISHQTETFFDANNTVEIAQQDTATILNLSVKFAAADQDWSVDVGVNNATDETYAVGGNSSLTTGSGYAEIGYARPRQWWAALTYDF